MAGYTPDTGRGIQVRVPPPLYPTPSPEPAIPMTTLLMLILTPVLSRIEPGDHTRSIEATGAQSHHFNWGSSSPVILCCDFTQYPPMANVAISHNGCDYSIFADQLLSGPNEIEWRAGKLRTHYWLRRVRVLVAYDHSVEVRFAVPEVEHALFWEGRFTQCSYNALATVLDHFYGVEGWAGEREEFEKQTFVAALKKHGLGAYYGWAPWTSYMVQAGTIQWNGHAVNDLKAERFSLRPREIPKPEGREMIVQYQPGEQAALVKDLLSRLEKGPVIIWTPYAAAMDRGRGAWRHIRTVDEETVAVKFSPNMTHSVVINLEGERVKVYDNSWPGGIWEVKPEIVVGTAAAMTGSVRVDRGNGKTLLGKGFGGIENDEYNVVFWKSEPEQ